MVLKSEHFEVANIAWQHQLYKDKNQYNKILKLSEKRLRNNTIKSSKMCKEHVRQNVSPTKSIPLKSH